MSAAVPPGGVFGPLLLDAWTRHRHPANLAFHAASGLAGWIGLLSTLAWVRTPLSLPYVGDSVGAWLALLAVLAWLPLDGLVALAVGLPSLVAVLHPMHPLVGALVFATALVAQNYAHVCWHEHASFLVGEPPARRALYASVATVFAPFVFGAFWALDRGWRPGLRQAFLAAERSALLDRHGGPWRNWAGTAGATPARISVPHTLDELVAVVRAARRAGRPIRVVGSGFSWSAIAPTDDLLIFTERLGGVQVDTTDPAHPAVWAEAGVTNRALDRALAAHGLAVPWNVVLENVRVAGIVSAGTHGSGRATGTMGDLVEAIEVVDSVGEVRLLSAATIGEEGMAAARCGLGLFGVILRVRLRVVPTWRVRQVDQTVSVDDALGRIADLVATHDSVELYWFAFNRRFWLRTFDRTDAPAQAGHGLAFATLNFVQNSFLRLCAPIFQTVARGWFPAFQGFAFRMLTFRTRVLPIAEALHYRKWIEMMPCGCVEVGFPMDADGANVRAAFAAAESLVERYGERGLYPMNLTLNVRFIGTSRALLSPAFGVPGVTCYIEALCLGRPEGWTEFSAELVAEWMRLPGALPHWAKEFEHVPGIREATREHLGDRIDRFRAALATVDPGAECAFSNPMLRRVLLQDEEAVVLRSAHGG